MTRRQTAKWRAIDFVLLAAVAAAAIWAARGLSESIAYRWDWPRALSYLLRFEDGEWKAGLLLHGLAATARLFVWGAIFALLFGVALAAARLAAARWARPAAIAYIELMRNIPPLVFMFVFYFFLSAQLPLPDLDAAVESPWLRAALSFCFRRFALVREFFRRGFVLGGVRRRFRGRGFARGDSVGKRRAARIGARVGLVAAANRALGGFSAGLAPRLAAARRTKRLADQGLVDFVGHFDPRIDFRRRRDGGFVGADFRKLDFGAGALFRALLAVDAGLSQTRARRRHGIGAAAAKRMTTRQAPHD